MRTIRFPRTHHAVRPWRSLAGAALVAVAVTACTGATPSTVVPGGASPSVAPPSGEPGTSPAASPSATPRPRPSLPSPAAEGSVPAAVIDAAIADAAGRAGVDPSEVTVLTTEAVTFPNGALGCPVPGQMYTQALTPGYRVVVEAGGTRYDYRAAAGSDGVRYCENPPGPG